MSYWRERLFSNVHVSHDVKLKELQAIHLVPTYDIAPCTAGLAQQGKWRRKETKNSNFLETEKTCRGAQAAADFGMHRDDTSSVLHPYHLHLRRFLLCEDILD
jgi:hypothetical protein